MLYLFGGEIQVNEEKNSLSDNLITGLTKYISKELDARLAEIERKPLNVEETIRIAERIQEIERRHKSDDIRREAIKAFWDAYKHEVLQATTPWENWDEEYLDEPRRV